MAPSSTTAVLPPVTARKKHTNYRSTNSVASLSGAVVGAGCRLAPLTVASPTPCGIRTTPPPPAIARRKPRRRPWASLSVLHVLITCWVLLGGWRQGAVAVVLASPTTEIILHDETFSPEWLEGYYGGELGCDLGRGSYTWRPYGFGSNMNNMLNAWVYAIAVEGWSDLSLVCDPGQLGTCDCYEESGGAVSNGWGCLFTDMPHLCKFDKSEDWSDHMVSRGVKEEERQEAARLTLAAVRFSPGDLDHSLEQFDTDHLGALAVVAKYLWSHMTLWLRRDVDFVTHVEETFQRSPFLAMHIRRGDKITQGEAKEVDVEEYLAAAVNYLEEDASRTPVDEIRGIWVASDDLTMADEVRTLAHTYFPNVLSEAIVFVAGGVPGGVETSGVATHTNKQDYGAFVYMMADLEQLAAADIFVGTFSSNVGRLVAVLRDGLGKPRSSAISMDTEFWWPGRQLSPALDRALTAT